MVIVATIYMSLLGVDDLERVASVSNENTKTLANKLVKINGVTIRFDNAFFNEVVINLPVNAEVFVTEMEKKGFMQVTS